jgi:hypothetical protein
VKGYATELTEQREKQIHVLINKCTTTGKEECKNEEKETHNMFRLETYELLQPQ